METKSNDILKNWNTWGCGAILLMLSFDGVEKKDIAKFRRQLVKLGFAKQKTNIYIKFTVPFKQFEKYKKQVRDLRPNQGIGTGFRMIWLTSRQIEGIGCGGKELKTYN